MNIRFKVDDQFVKRIDDIKLVAGTTDYIYAEFYFSKEWENFEKTVQFTREPDTYNVAIVDGKCKVPWEIIQTAGGFTVSVFGGDLFTSSVGVIDVIETGYVDDGSFPADPTPSYFVNIALAEDGRVIAEDGRNDAEIIRLASEITRISSEGDRDDSEVIRLASEIDRVLSETDRNDAEIIRLANEISRVSSESDRDNAEIIRLASEIIRVDAENARAITFDGYDGRITTVETEVDSKINTTQIANNLTETVAGKVLDATQGKILADTKADKVQGAWITPTLLNGWQHDAFGLYKDFQYRVNTFGYLELRGSLYGGVVGQPVCNIIDVQIPVLFYAYSGGSTAPAKCELRANSQFVFHSAGSYVAFNNTILI